MPLIRFLPLLLLLGCGPPTMPPIGRSSTPTPVPHSVLLYGGGHEVGATLSRISAFTRGFGPPLELRVWARQLVSDLDPRATIDGNWRFVLFEVEDGEHAFAILIPRDGDLDPQWRWTDILQKRVAVRALANHLVITTSPTWIDHHLPFTRWLVEAPTRGDLEARWPLARWAMLKEPLPLLGLSTQGLGAGPRWLQSHVEATLRQLVQGSLSLEFSAHVLKMTVRFETQRGSQAALMLQGAPTLDSAALRNAPAGPPALVAGRISAAGWSSLDRLLRAASDRKISAPDGDARTALMGALGGVFFVSLHAVGSEGELGLFGMLHPDQPERLAPLIHAAPSVPGPAEGIELHALDLEGEHLLIAQAPEGFAFALGDTGKAVLDGVFSGAIDHGPGANPDAVAALQAATPGSFLLLMLDPIELMRLFGNERLHAALEGLASAAPLSISLGALKGTLSIRLNIPKEQLSTLVRAAFRLWRNTGLPRRARPKSI